MKKLILAGLVGWALAIVISPQTVMGWIRPKSA